MNNFSHFVFQKLALRRLSLGLMAASVGMIWGVDNASRLAQAQSLSGDIPKVSELSNPASTDLSEIKSFKSNQPQRYQLNSKSTSPSESLSQVTSVS